MLPQGVPLLGEQGARPQPERRQPVSAVSAPERSYRDDNHKPELVYALSRLDAMVGFRAPRRAAELLADLDTPLAADLHAILAADPTSAGVRTAFEWLLRPETRPGADGRRQVRRGVRAPARRRVAVAPDGPDGHAPGGRVSRGTRARSRPCCSTR